MWKNVTFSVSVHNFSVPGYVVQKRTYGDPNWVKANDYTLVEPSFTATHLPEGSEMEFRIIAQNAAGDSEPSNATAPVKVRDTGKTI